MNEDPKDPLRACYQTLFATWGRQHWWPAQSRFEVIVGAFLTQNTAWTNVEKALHSLRKVRLLTIDGIRRTPRSRLAKLIRSSGYFRQKAQRLKGFVRFLDRNYSGSLAQMFARPTAALRDELLALNGIGPETADSILLYAGNHPVFVVDAYTRRILERHNIISHDAGYEDIRQRCEHSLSSVAAAAELTLNSSHPHPQPHGTCHRPSRMSASKRTAVAQVFNEMHGLVVAVGKNYCLKSQPRCEQCPLQKILPPAKLTNEEHPKLEIILLRNRNRLRTSCKSAANFVTRGGK